MGLENGVLNSGVVLISGGLDSRLLLYSLNFTMASLPVYGLVFLHPNFISGKRGCNGQCMPTHVIEENVDHQEPKGCRPVYQKLLHNCNRFRQKQCPEDPTDMNFKVNYATRSF